MTTPLISPAEEQFEALNPELLLDPARVTPQQWASIPADHGVYRDLLDVSVGIGVAYLVLIRLVGNDIRLTGRFGDTFTRVFARTSGDTLKYVIKDTTSGYQNAWTYMVNPAIQHAFRLGATGQMTYSDEIAYASAFSHQIFDYVNETSAEALVTAYQSQLADKWHPDIAWARASAGYGLESRSMSQYIKMLAQGEGREIVPSVARGFVEKALQERANRIGLNESYRAQEMGKTLVWLSQYRAGELPVDTQRKWLTAEDERVCPVCGPMDHVQVPMEDKFELPDGNKIWAPGVHPNCRCSVELSYPELAMAKRYDPREPRDEGGRWSKIAVREPDAAPVTAPTEPEVTAPVRTGSLQQISAPTRVEQEQAVEVTAPVRVQQVVEVTAPVRTSAAVTAPVRAEAPAAVEVTAPVRLAVEQKQDTSRGLHFNPPSRRKYYAFANDLDYHLGNGSAWGDDNGDHADPTMWARGVNGEYVVNLDRLAQKTRRGNETRFALHARPMPDHREIAEIASYKYTDQPNYLSWEQQYKSKFDDDLNTFYQQALDQQRLTSIALNSSILSDRAVRSIYQMAGMDDAYDTIADPIEARQSLIMGVSRLSPLYAAYMHYLEKNIPTAIPIGPVVAEDAYQRDMAGLNPHVTDVFVFDKGFWGGIQSESDNSRLDHALISGRYEIYKTELVPLKPQIGPEDTPSNMEALRLLHLQPADLPGALPPKEPQGPPDW